MHGVGYTALPVLLQVHHGITPRLRTGAARLKSSRYFELLEADLKDPDQSAHSLLANDCFSFSIGI